MARRARTLMMRKREKLFKRKSLLEIYRELSDIWEASPLNLRLRT
jgi:hypothetical protein